MQVTLQQNYLITKMRPSYAKEVNSKQKPMPNTNASSQNAP